MWHQGTLLKSLHPLTLTNSITRKSSVAVSISSTSMMMFGCFTRRRIDTSFSIRCSCQTKGCERWIRNHGTPCSILENSIIWRFDTEGSISLGAETHQTLAYLVSIGTGQVSVTSHCHQQKETGLLPNSPQKGSVGLPWHPNPTTFLSLHYFQHLEVKALMKAWAHGTVLCNSVGTTFSFQSTLKQRRCKGIWHAYGMQRRH